MRNNIIPLHRCEDEVIGLDAARDQGIAKGVWVGAIGTLIFLVTLGFLLWYFEI